MKFILFLAFFLILSIYPTHPKSHKNSKSSHLKSKLTHSLKSKTHQNTTESDQIESEEKIPVFLGGLHPLSDNQKSPTFMPIEKNLPTSKAPNGQSFNELNYTKANKIKVKTKNESREEVPAGYYGESRITYYV